MSDTGIREEKNKVEGGTLYLVATPIGNLADISQRAVRVLSEVDFVAAEDTRNSAKLLALLGVKRPMLSYFEHNKKERGRQIIDRLKEGQSCALVTDAGTPAISDPGFDLVRLCIEEGIPVTALPGCCAAVNALVLSGLDARRFLFEGFLEGSERERKEALFELSSCTRTMIFYEAPHRLRQTLSEMKEAFGEERKIALCREMTKLNEEVLRFTVLEACAYYENNDPRGEYVLVVEGKSREDAQSYLSLSLEEHLRIYTDAGLSRMDAIKAVARDRGVGKAEIYKQLL